MFGRFALMRNPLRLMPPWRGDVFRTAARIAATSVCGYPTGIRVAFLRHPELRRATSCLLRPKPRHARWVELSNEDPMPETSVRNTRNKLAKVYGLGILAFTVIVGFITLLVKFLASVSQA